jgi:hypothetical protein
MSGKRQPVMPSRSGLSEDIRLRFLYRDLILRGKVRITRGAAKGLIGPDCAFRLYTLPARDAR